jgi:putative FmdB family regulatory protein
LPTYSYKCTECGTAFDIQQAFTDDSLTECPNCGGTLRKVFSAVGVTFNGAGFYRNDSRAGTKTDTSSPAPAAKSDSTPSAPTESKKAASPSKAAD